MAKVEATMEKTPPYKCLVGHFGVYLGQVFWKRRVVKPADKIAVKLDVATG